MVALTTTELIALWNKYLKDLNSEATRADAILDILDNLPFGVIIQPPPLIDFTELANNGTKMKVLKADPDARRNSQWSDDIIAILENADPRHPLLTVSEIQDIFHRKNPIDTRQRGLISSAAHGLHKRGLCGRVADSTGKMVYGSLDYFLDDKTTIKPEYAGFLRTPATQIEILGRIEAPALPPPPPPAKKGPETLTEDEIDLWRWSAEIEKFLETHDASNGLLSKAQILEYFTSRYTNFKNNKTVEQSLPAHLSALYEKCRVGRIAVKNPKMGNTGARKELYVYGGIRYFDKVPEKEGARYSALKKEYEYLELSVP